MKIFAHFKKMNKLGAAMVEYAVILAFVAAVGSSFTDNISPGVNNIIKSVSSMLGLAANGNETQQSAKDKVAIIFRDFYNGVSTKGSLYDKNKLLESLAKEIVSGGHQTIEEILRDLKIDTLYAFDEKGKSKDQFIEMDLIPADAGYVKLLTIANENGLDRSHTEPFSATQYLFYSKNNKLYLAATRNIDSVTNYKFAPETANKGYSCKKKLSSAQCTILGATPEQNITFQKHDINDRFVKYEPK